MSLAGAATRVGGGGGTGAPASGGGAQFTREHLIRLGREGDPWVFAHLGVQAVRLLPADAELRFLLAAAYAKLGLRTAALEQLELLTQAQPGHAEHAGVVQLRATIADGLADDRVSVDERVRVLEANLTALATRERGAVDLRAHVARWREQAEREEVFRARGGNVLRRRSDGTWVRFGDERAAMAGVLTAPGPSATVVDARPVYFEGVDPPWALELAGRVLKAHSDGSMARVTIVVNDVMDALDGLSMVDVSGLLGQARTDVFIGEGSGERLLEHLRGRVGLSLGSGVLTLGAGAGAGLRSRATARVDGQTLVGVRAILDRAIAEQRAALAAARVEVERRDAGRTLAQRRERWRLACAPGSAEPLRVLIPVSRFTTFIKHSARDLARALEACGCVVRVETEPDDASAAVAGSSWLGLREFDPDLVVVINWTRWMLPDVAPAGVPVVTWVQDRAGGLFRSESGASVGPADLVIGHLHPELFESFGYSRERAMPTPVLVSQAKFHDGPVARELEERMACEVAYVSHHSETPERMVERFVQAAEPGQRVWVGRLTAELLQGIAGITASGLQRAMLPALDELVSRTCGRVLGREDARTRAEVMSVFAAPLGERVLRHQMLGWVKAACDKHGWRLNLYGRGWEKHPTLAACARGELAHDEELRAAYRGARLNVHGGLGGVQHQRVFECALSGGCTLVRLKLDDLRILEWWVQNDIAHRGGVVTQADPKGEWTEHVVTPMADHWGAMQVRAMYDRCGAKLHNDRHGWQALAKAQIETPWKEQAGFPTSYDAAWVIGEPTAAGFWNAETFERAARNIIERPAARADIAAWQRGCTARAFTYEAMAARLIERVRAGVEAVGAGAV